MGLDGISINQLRVTPEHNSAQLNEAGNFGQIIQNKAVDGLSKGQIVDPDKKNDHDQNTFDFDSENSENSAEGEDNDLSEIKNVVKYDLSKSDKYILKIDDNTNSILIVDKTTKQILEQIDATQLTKFASYMSEFNGSIVNRKL